MATDVSQYRSQLILPTGKQVYRIVTVVVDKGDLPNLEIFVTTINDAIDPTADTFLRIATPFDLSNLTKSRVTAVANGYTVYLSASAVNDFDSLEAGIKATTELKGRINALVSTWLAYEGEFLTSPAVTYSFPNADETYIQLTKDAYASAKAARVSAESALTAWTAAVVDAETAIDDLNDLVAFLAELHTGCDLLLHATTGYWPLLQGDMAAADPYLVPAYTPPPNYAFVSPRAGQVDTALVANCNLINGQYATSLTALSAAQTTLNTNQKEKNKAVADLTTAQEAEDAALAAVIAVCPSFDPESV
jgi:hypothetical protein